MELGIYSFGDRIPDPHTGAIQSATERMAQLIECAKLADELGLDVIGVGEHHRLAFIDGATATTLSAIAAVTKRIRVTSSSTIIATADPVRTFQEFATVDLVSDGRAELVFGRGSSAESFPLFGFELEDYDALFLEKVQLFQLLNTQERVTWSGRFRTPLVDAEIAPRPVQPQLPVSIGALSPHTIVRAARLGLPLAIPLLGGVLPHYARLTALYRRAWQEAGHDPASARIAGYSHLHVADTDSGARSSFYPYYDNFFTRLAGRSISRATFDQQCQEDGVLVLGSAQEIIDRIIRIKESLGLTRYVGQIDVGGIPFGQMLQAIEIYATQVAPVVRSHS